MITDSLAALYTQTARNTLTESVSKIEHCIAQLSEEEAWWRPTEEQNSIANLVLHLCGNLRQWGIAGVTKTADKRNRPLEFSRTGGLKKPTLLELLKTTSEEAKRVWASLSADQLQEERVIQGFSTTVLGAIFHTLTHFQGHTQEITSLTRMQLRERYQFAFIPTTPEEISAFGDE